MRQRRLQSEATGLPVRIHGSGFAAEGPGFYIWDEDLAEVLRVARELAREARRAGPVTSGHLPEPGGSPDGA